MAELFSLADKLLARMRMENNIWE